MSKYQESLDRLATIRLDLIEDGETKLKQSIYGIHDNADLEMTGDLSTLSELVDKETPKKVKIERWSNSFSSEPYRARCPRCNTVVFTEGHPYCFHCGQHLDWSD